MLAKVVQLKKNLLTLMFHMFLDGMELTSTTIVQKTIQLIVLMSVNKNEAIISEVKEMPLDAPSSKPRYGKKNKCPKCGHEY